MNPDQKKLEKIFINSTSPDELFDAFDIAVKEGIRNEVLYKSLLWNNALSPDEISMYAEKICKEFPELSYNIFFWTGKIFSTISLYYEHSDRAFKYFCKAADIDKKNHEPYLEICSLYNKELNIPNFHLIESFVKEGINEVEIKSKLCFALSGIYKKRGSMRLMKEYQNRGEMYQKEGS